jgi:hypothetical protein
MNLSNIIQVLQSSEKEKEDLLGKNRFKFLDGDSKKHPVRWVDKKDLKRAVVFPHSQDVLDEYNRIMGKNISWFANYVIFIPNVPDESSSIMNELRDDFETLEFKSIQDYISNDEIVKDIFWIHRGTPVDEIFRKANLLVVAYGGCKAFKAYELQ